MDYIFYHGKCPDGWCSAFIANKRYPEALLVPLDHGDPPPFEIVKDRDCLVLDFSWPVREDNVKLHDSAKSFHIYDHHKSALERIGGLPFVTFDMLRSGAGLTWDYLFGEDSGHRTSQGLRGWFPRPYYVNYVEDRDLWNWALPGSKAINAYLMSLPMTIEAWSHLDTLKVEYAEQSGVGILRHVDRYVQEAADEAQRGFMLIPGRDNAFYTVEIVNMLYANCSEVGNVLAQRADVGLTWFERRDGQTQFSLRSIGDIDVSEIAKVYAGGGHKNAAGFRLPTGVARELIDTILGRQDERYTG
jgi:oligoribonuclease NrnB/cAMP/cGMP phosphodiesterase (DHH superfamily)